MIDINKIGNELEDVFSEKKLLENNNQNDYDI